MLLPGFFRCKPSLPSKKWELQHRLNGYRGVRVGTSWVLWGYLLEEFLLWRTLGWRKWKCEASQVWGCSFSGMLIRRGAHSQASQKVEVLELPQRKLDHLWSAFWEEWETQYGMFTPLAMESISFIFCPDNLCDLTPCGVETTVTVLAHQSLPLGLISSHSFLPLNPILSDGLQWLLTVMWVLNVWSCRF